MDISLFLKVLWYRIYPHELAFMPVAGVSQGRRHGVKPVHEDEGVDTVRHPPK